MSLRASDKEVGGKRKYRAKSVVPVTLLILPLLGVIYLGIATTTALRVALLYILSLIGRLITWQVFDSCPRSTGQITCKIMFIFVGASLISIILVNKGMPDKIALRQQFNLTQ